MVSQKIDMAPLVPRAREIMAGCAAPKVESEFDPGRLAAYNERMGSAGKGGEIILAADTSVELGSPSRASSHAVIWTREPGLVRHGRISRAGPDISESAGKELDYAQIVLAAIGEGEPDPFKLESIQFLTRRLPGLMARSIPGRLWLRVSHRAVEAGLDFAVLGTALGAAFQEEVPEVIGVECLFVTSSHECLSLFTGLASEARIYSGRHKKVALGDSGDYECEELNCDDCDEKPVCDRIREVVIIRRKSRRDRKG